MNHGFHGLSVFAIIVTLGKLGVDEVVSFLQYLEKQRGGGDVVALLTLYESHMLADQ